MSLGQVQLVKWTLPALALILGLLWYKRRRVDRVDPGGPSDQDLKADKTEELLSPRKKTSSLASPQTGNDKRRDSGINSDESLNTSLLNTSTSSPLHGSISPRKVSESLDIPGRSSVPVAAFSAVPWYDVEEEEEEEVADTPVKMQNIELGSQPAKTGCDLLSKSRSSAELMANSAALKENATEQMRQQKKAKIVVANGSAPIVQEFQPSKREDKSTKAVESQPQQKPQQQQQQQQQRKQQPQTKSQKQQQQSQQQKESQPKQQAQSQQQPLVNGEAKKQESSQQVISERDSANHSPVSGVLDGSVTDEARSEGSTDSGKGGSIKGGHVKKPDRQIYDFVISNKLVGKLIGRQGKFLQHVRKSANVKIMVKEHPTDSESNICSIDGTLENIMTALDVIRQNFPEKTYPNLTLEQIIYEEPVDEIAWVPELMQLSLVEGVNNDVIVTHIAKPNHIFVQLPTHPTYPSLRILDQRMTHEYDTVESPPAPDQLSKGMILVAKWYNKWVRVCVENPDPRGEESLVRLVDHGSYWTFSNAEMRAIRTDYLTLPFQAIEVFLANIKPKDGEWTQEAYNVVAQLCSNSVGQAQIVGYVDFSVYINLYFNIHKHGYVSVADELIARGLAEPASLEEVVPQEVLPPVVTV